MGIFVGGVCWGSLLSVCWGFVLTMCIRWGSLLSICACGIFVGVCVCWGSLLGSCFGDVCLFGICVKGDLCLGDLCLLVFMWDSCWDLCWGSSLLIFVEGLCLGSVTWSCLVPREFLATQLLGLRRATWGYFGLPLPTDNPGQHGRVP